MRQKTSKNSANSAVISTGGEIFDDGTILELVEDASQPTDLALLKWHRRKVVVSPRVVHQGHTYVPITLDPSVRRALRLPSRCEPFGPTVTLFHQLVAAIAKFTDVGEHFGQLLAAFALSSWLADCLPAPVKLSLWSPVATDGARVLMLLNSLCRHALPLAGATALDLRLLPYELQPTLLIFRPAAGRRTMETLASLGWRGFHVVRSGHLGELLGAIAVSTDTHLDERTLGPMIEIPVNPSTRSLPVMSRQSLEEVARDFQPKLLYYRLLHHQEAVGPENGGGAPAGQASQLALGLRACFPDQPGLGDQVVALVSEVNSNGGEKPLSDPLMLLAEVLIRRCHEPERREMYVAEVALDINALAFARGPAVELTARLAGALLKSLGLPTRKLGRKGRGLALDQSTRRRIHQIARAYKSLSSGQLFPGCAECAQLQPTVA